MWFSRFIKLCYHFHTNKSCFSHFKILVSTFKFYSLYTAMPKQSNMELKGKHCLSREFTKDCIFGKKMDLNNKLLVYSIPNNFYCLWKMTSVPSSETRTETCMKRKERKGKETIEMEKPIHSASICFWRFEASCWGLCTLSLKSSKEQKNDKGNYRLSFSQWSLLFPNEMKKKGPNSLCASLSFLE